MDSPPVAVMFPFAATAAGTGPAMTAAVFDENASVYTGDVTDQSPHEHSAKRDVLAASVPAQVPFASGKRMGLHAPLAPPAPRPHRPPRAPGARGDVRVLIERDRTVLGHPRVREGQQPDVAGAGPEPRRERQRQQRQRSASRGGSAPANGRRGHQSTDDTRASRSPASRA